MTQEQLEIAEVFMPNAIREMKRIKENNIRFVHYTSAEAGLKIIRSKNVYLRNSTVMNDFSEIDHGWRCLKNAYNNSPLGERLEILLRKIQADLPEIFKQNFQDTLQEIQSQTYLISISEHGNQLGQVDEDAFGRLSMWRAYGPQNGVAFVLNNKAFVNESDALGAYTSPVIYRTLDEYKVDFEEIICAMEANIEKLSKYGGKYIHDILQNTFKFSIQSTKHPAFKEEKEWRIIYFPPTADVSPQRAVRGERIKLNISSIRGVPQKIYLLPLNDFPDEGFVGATLPDLIDRILIGPSLDSYQIWEALVKELEDAGVNNPKLKVFITGIPLRAS